MTKRKWIILLIIILILIIPYKINITYYDNGCSQENYLKSLTYSWFSFQPCQETTHYGMSIPVIGFTDYKYFSIALHYHNIGETHLRFSIWDFRGELQERLFDWKW